MNTGHFFKSAEALVLNRFDAPGLVLQHQQNGAVEVIDAYAAEKWLSWEPNLLSPQDVDRLVETGFLLETDHAAGRAEWSSSNVQVPEPADVFVKSYFESPDLTVLFCTRQMPGNNPLLVLNGYGTICWRGVIAGHSIGEIREEVSQVFGVDEVAPFFRRLTDMGFIKPLQLPDAWKAETIKKEFSAPGIQFRLSHSRIPWYCLWELCMKCNYRCKICYLPQFETNGPGAGQALETAQQIIDSGIFYVCLLGGEPLLREDLEAIILKLRQSGVFVKIITNGYHLSETRARRFAEIGLNQIEVSFDGLSRETHEASRGLHSFGQALSAIMFAKLAGIPRIAVVWTTHSGNIHELDRLPDFLKGAGVRECYISQFKKTGLNGSVSAFDPPTYEQLEVIKEKLELWAQRNGDLQITLLPACSCGHTSMVIGDNGDVRLCSFSYNAIGNLYEKPLLEVWNYPWYGESIGYCSTNLNNAESPLLAD